MILLRAAFDSKFYQSLNEDSENYRSPHLVPYSKVDDAIKKANRGNFYISNEFFKKKKHFSFPDTASETVRTLLVYGYLLDPPTQEANEAAMAEALRQKYAAFRTYRVEKNYAVTSGKWYFEFEVLSVGPMRVGWARSDSSPGMMLGSDEMSWAFDGYNVSVVLNFQNFVVKNILLQVVIDANRNYTSNWIGKKHKKIRLFNFFSLNVAT